MSLSGSIDRLLRHLGPEETGRIRLRLAGEPSARDPCRRLDSTIILHLVDYLEAEDLVPASQVSQTWRAMFSSPVVTLRILRCHFYDKFRSYQRLDDASKESRKSWLAAWLPAALRDVVARKRLRARSMWKHDLSPPPEMQVQSDMQFDGQVYGQFCNGRVAERSELERVHVTSLFTKKTKICTLENRENINDWMLGDDFLVACITRKKDTFVAWSLQSDEFFTIKLPTSPYDYLVMHDRVAIMLRECFLVWQIGASLKEFKYPMPVKIREGFQARIILHPYDPEKVYAVYSTAPSKNPAQLIKVQLFEWEGNKYNGQVAQVHIDDNETKVGESYFLEVAFSKTAGLYTLASCLGMDPPAVQHLCNKDVSPVDNVTLLIDIDFTTTEPRMSIRDVHLHDDFPYPQPHVWGQQQLRLGQLFSPDGTIDSWKLVADPACGRPGVQTGADPNTYTVAVERPRDLHDYNMYAYRICSDEDFIVVIETFHIHVRCFLNPAEFERRKALCEPAETLAGFR
ncbi:hypothetical protein PVAG01_07444 [Phlyctema vagabunda]|uniref:F-box domain-containing protein n=1 Tax=Phlyctema vagabunda TaxID=108571 RepID=A0ABR4PCF7_9HELO